MPIEELTADDLVQSCARCGAVRRVPVSELVAGVENPLTGVPTPSLVRLPACPECRAQEFLVATGEPETGRSVSPAFLHRVLVDVLLERLMQSGRVTPGVDAAAVRPSQHSEEDLARWLPNGFRMPEQPSADTGGDTP